MTNDTKPSSLLTRFARLTAPLVRFWDGAREFGRAIKPCRFSLIMVLAGILFLLCADQGLDTLRDFAERKAGSSRDASQTLFFHLGAILWVYGSWYWARAMCYLKLDGVQTPSKWDRRAQKWMPRLIGGAAILSLVLAFYLAALPYPDAPGGPGGMLKRYALYSLLGAVAFFVFVVKRRDWMNRASAMIGRRGRARLAGYLRIARADEETYGNREIGEFLSGAWILWLTLLIACALFLVFAVAPSATAPAVGSAAILLLAAGGWIAFGSAMDILSLRSRLPVFTSLLLFAILFSLWNDNHAPRDVSRREPPQASTQRDDVRTALGLWLASQLPTREPEIPLVIVAAEGGGIRAAYWTGTVLGTIQDRHPQFAQRLFGLSGVSGGSLGSSVFAALLAEGDALAQTPCAREARAKPYTRCAQRVLSEDFLSPAIAGMLYPDLLQRVLPFPVPAFDRARALEGAWENAWRLHIGNDRFRSAFDTLWPENAGRGAPALFLNASWVETGKRFVVSNLRIEEPVFHDAVDARQTLTHRIPLSTAAHLSARFTYVSPAATISDARGPWGHVVDGGYFENSGTVTAEEIVQEVLRLKRAGAPSWKKVRPLVVLISNEPLNPKLRDGKKSPPSNPVLNEVLSPIDALINAREARAAQAIGVIRSVVEAKNFFHFGLCQEHVDIPLGWTLSSLTEKEMERQLNEPGCLKYDNRDSLKRLAQALGAGR
jgi:hypothetical protein